MGGGASQKPKPTLQDTTLQIKMASKRMQRESAKSMKESAAYMKKAKEALKKNNEDSAKLYLQSAASKRTEAMSIQRMALKMEYIAANIKNMKNNQATMNSFQSMSTAVGYLNNPNFQAMSNNMQNFQKAMDDMMIGGKMMQQIMSQPNMGTDSTANQMLNALKGQLAMQTENNVNEAAMIKQRQIKLEVNLKKL